MVGVDLRLVGAEVTGGLKAKFEGVPDYDNDKNSPTHRVPLQPADMWHSSLVTLRSKQHCVHKVVRADCSDLNSALI